VTVFDASALLAFLAGEPGADLVERTLEEGGHCSAANWSEVAQKVIAADGDWGLARALLFAYPLQVENVTEQDAEWAAHAWRRGSGLSLADRLCLAAATRLDTEVLTADGAWSDRVGGVLIRQIR